jgi:hypothetical protein
VSTELLGKVYGQLGSGFGQLGQVMGGAGQQFAGLGSTGLQNLTSQINTLAGLGATRQRYTASWL